MRIGWTVRPFLFLLNAGFLSLAAAGCSVGPESHPPGDQATSGVGQQGLPEVHAVAVYQGALPEGQQRGFREHPQGTVEVRVALANKPLTLVLISYEPVAWRVSLDSGVHLQSIILRGHYKQTVNGPPPRIPIDVASSVEDGWKYFRSVITTRNRHLTFKDEVTQMAGQEPLTVQSRTTGTAFIVDGQRTLTFQDQHGIRGSGPVTFTSIMEPVASTLGAELLSSDKLSTTYCCAGAFTTSTASVAYSRGKRYVEFTLHLSKGAQTITGHTDVGLMLADQHASGFAFGRSAASYGVGRKLESQSPFADGDIIGLAIDLDGSRLYVHRNGTWLNGDPNIRQGGTVLKPNREYVAGVTVGSPQEDGGTSDRWTANFGATTFAYPIPKGYAAYRGTE